jgi:hypothetical protein
MLLLQFDFSMEELKNFRRGLHCSLNFSVMVSSFPTESLRQSDAQILDPGGLKQEAPCT